MIRFGLFILPLALWATALGRDSVDRWIASTDLPVLAIETSEEVLDRNGHLLRAYTVADGRWRLNTSLDGVDPRYIRMLIAYEDKRFLRHNGVDMWAIVRATGQAIRNGEIVSGGSTLTMQVSRLLEDGPTGTWRGKLRQVRVALALERKLSKQDILSLYVNRAPMGGNLEGVRSASYAYFGKEPRRLTPAESALLVALPQSPEARRPDRYSGRAFDARNRVLSRALDAGVIDKEQLFSAETVSVSSNRSEFPKLAPHLSDRVRLGNGEIVLTIDADLQSRMEVLASRAASEAGINLSVAMVIADHQTGEILASVGSSSYREDGRGGFVDMTQAVRSPGSTLKPLVYGLAMDQGLVHPETLIEDQPKHFGTYAPQNFDGQFRGTVRVRDALQQSLNLPVVALTEALGPSRLLVQMRNAGMKVRLPGGQPGLAVSLGGLGVDLHGLVQLYAAIASGGSSVQLHVETDFVPPKPHRILSAETAWMIGDILSEIPPPKGSADLNIAYKTGTSYGHRDAWAIGFDGRHVIGVWMGRPDGSAVPGAFGGDLAAPIVFQAFAQLKSQVERLPPPPPSTLLVSHAQLPPPLRRFESRNAPFEVAKNSPRVTFPPDGSQVAVISNGVLARVQKGMPPFTWLADGKPILMNSYERATMLPISGKGFVTLSVIDAAGKSARSTIQLQD